MSLMVSEKSNSNKIPPLADGTYPAVCYLLADIGMQYNARFERKNRQVVLGWEIVGETVTIDGKEKPRTFYNTYTASLDAKSKLRATLKAWRGRDFTPDELKQFDLRNICGVPCFLTLTTTVKDDGTQYSSLAGVAKLPKGFPAPVGTLGTIVYDIDESDPKDIALLPDWVQRKITESESYQERIAPKFEELDNDERLPL